jgi:heterodisulfide reductase subunit A
MSLNGQPRIGVFVCHCGTNIAGKVNVAEVVAFAAKLDGVAVAKEYKFMCSDPGQDLIQQSIRDHGLNRVVVASCSPLMHEPTFRNVTAGGGLNPFYFQMANIREQASWVTLRPEDATKKAKALVSAAVRRVALHEPLAKKEVPVRPEVLIVGGGIAGIQAALTYAKSGKKVYLVEREPSIGGHMSQLDKTFPTLDCSACILTPKMSEVGKHPLIELLTMSEVEGISGFVGNFKVKVRRKARYVDISKCNGCGACWENCPTTITPSERVIRKGPLVIKRAGKETPPA